MTTPPNKPLKIFCSYAHEDEAYVAALRKSLRPLERQELIEWWHDREIVPGQEWREAIEENLQAADITLLLISPDFMASDFAYEEEMLQAIARHERGDASVIPIIVRRTDLEGAPFKHLQSLPKDLRPINAWSDRDEAWLDVASGIRKAINRLVSERGGREQEIAPTPQHVESGEPVEHTKDREIADTVTFLFTSMEDSTSLWQRYRLQMPSVLRRHFEILRSCVEKHRGRVFKTVGDACCAVFADPVEGLRAALEAQKALLTERWSGKVPVRVSMALHTGPAIEERDGDYVGPPVNLVTRLLSVARGGQVLLSGVATELVSDDLPYFEPGAELRNLGAQRLKDITRPVQIFQLLAPGIHHVEGLESPDADEERYRIERLLGEGGIARVYLAYEMEFDRTVALKVLREDYTEDSEVIERFGREARSAGRLSGHPHIVTIYARGRSRDGSYYLAMEYVPGGTLKDLIEREGPLSADEVVEIALQVAHALKFAHEHGIIHRDVKPQNVLLTGSGEAKVADFGIARALEATTMTRTGSILGTPQYLSPEQALGQPANPQSDLYALGVVLYEMLTGELPFDAETPIGIAMKHISGELRPPRELKPEVPEQLNDITVKLLAREPKERYSNAGALIEDLQQVSKGFAIAAGRILDGSDEASRVETTSETADREREEQIRRLEGLYAQAHQAHEGQEWQAVVDAFKQIHAEDPAYPDPEGLLAAAREALEAQELAQRVTALYAKGQRHMDAEEWQQALQCFEEVQRLEPGYRESEGLLSQVRRELAPPPTVAVPDLSGQSIPQVRRTLSQKGLRLGSQNDVSSDTVREGQIIEQSPEAGADAESGSTVDVTISSGASILEVPDLTDMTRSEARNALRAADLELGTLVKTSSEDVPEGNIVEQYPVAGTRAKRGDSVRITVSSGVPPDLVQGAHAGGVADATPSARSTQPSVTQPRNPLILWGGLSAFVVLAVAVVIAFSLRSEPSPSESGQAQEGGGGGGFDAAANANKTLTVGDIGWTENVAVANLTKVVLEEDLGYKEVELKTLDVGLLFEGVAGGDLDAFQDVWMPNHEQLLSEVENDVEHLDPWYEGTTSFGLAVPNYMKGVNSIADLNQSGAERIIGIEPGALISQVIEDNVIPEYNLDLEHEPSSTAAMLAEVERLYNDKEPFVFTPWCPHPMCGQWDFRYLEDPKNSQGNLDYGPQSDTSASISSIVNENLSKDDPVAYAFISKLRLDQDELVSLETEIEKAESPVAGAKAWLKENRDVVQPAIDAAKQAQ